MKRSLVAATAVALLLTGCATGDTGHLVPDIEPELVGPLTTPDDVGAAGGTEDTAVTGDAPGEEAPGEEAGDEEAGAGEEAAAGTGTEPAAGTEGAAASSDPTDVRAAFDAASGAEAWFAEVTDVVVDGSTVQVTTALTAAGADAVAVCEAAVDAAESTGVAATAVSVLAEDGAVLSQLDAAAGDVACSG